MASSQVKQLKDANEGLISIVPLIGSALPGENAAARKQLSPIELFCEFYKSRFSEQPSDEMKELFVSAMEESNET